MIGGATAQRIAYAVGKVVVRHVLEDFASKYVRLTYDLAEAVGEVMLDEYGKREKAAKPNGNPSSSDIISVMARMSPSDVGRSIDAALASPDMRETTASMTPQEKDALRQRAVRKLFDFGSLFKFVGKFEAIATAERLDPSGEKTASSRETELRDKLGPVRAELVMSLEERNYAQVRAHADVILAKLATEREELVALLQRLDGIESRAAAERRDDPMAEAAGREEDGRKKLATLKSELMKSLGRGDFEHARALADAILAISPADREQLVSLLQRLDAVEARAVAERGGTDRLDEKAERVRRWADARNKRVMLAWDLMTSLRKGEYEQVRGRANALLALLTTDQEELVSLLERIDAVEAHASAEGL